MFRTVVVLRDVVPWRRLVALVVSRGPTTVVVDGDANDDPNGVLDGAPLGRAPRSPSGWAELLDGVDGVVHAADGQGIDPLVAGLCHVARRPRVLVFAEPIDREARADDDRSVPSSASPAARTSIETIRRAGVRVSVARLGSCVDANTGPVPDLVPLYLARLGLRARGPNGFVAWCHGHDIARAIDFAIDSPLVGDAFDVVAPEPATLAELDEALAEALDRRPLLRISTAAAGLLLGSAFTRALALGRRVHPEALVRAGFPFVYPDVRSAILDAVRDRMQSS